MRVDEIGVYPVGTDLSRPPSVYTALRIRKTFQPSLTFQMLKGRNKSIPTGHPR